MFELSHLPLFVLASLAVLLSPGPNVLYVITRGMSQGRRAGVVSVLGLETGTLLQVAGAALGISAIAMSSALAGLRRVFGQGVLVGVFNPKTALFFLAFLPQFVDPTCGNLALQTALLGLIFIALATTTDGGYALLAASLGQRLSRSKHFATGQRYFAATMFIALGVSAALTEKA